MKLFDALFRKRTINAQTINAALTKENSPISYPPIFNGHRTVTPINAMQITTVYACVRVISEAIAELPLHIYRMDGEKQERAHNHSLYYLLHDAPNELMTSFVFRETIMTHLLLWGNAYIYKRMAYDGKIVALYPLKPSKMTVNRGITGKLIYTYTVDENDAMYNGESKTFTWDNSDIMHIPGLGFDGLIGYSPIAMARNAIGVAMATEEYGASFFENNASPGGVLEHPG
ncbi:MAG: phage portal protein, partial [Clostridiales bacterium]|nr:phage portal protein [Clostridiales bacterium]